MNDEIRQDIISMMKISPKYYWRDVKKKYQEILDRLYPAKPLLQQIFLLLSGNKEPACCICGSPDLYFLNVVDGYSKTCSKKCGYQLRKIEYKQKYGVENPSQVQEIKDKQTNSFKNRSEEEKQKTRLKTIKTNQEKYGVDNYAQTDEYKEKSRLSSLKRYGTQSPNQAEDVKKKQRMSLLNNFGVDNPSKSQELKKKKRETCLENYGVEHPSQASIVQENRKKNLQEKHGVSIYSHIFWSSETKRILLDKKILAGELEKFTPVQLANKLGVAFSTVYNYAVEYGIRERYIDFSTENVIKSILEKFSISYIKNDRIQIKPKELDFYLPEYKIAIEVCGLMWHSELNGKDKSYHLNKLNLCEEQNIRLITIFEDELGNYDKLEKRLSYILKKDKKIANARDCEVRIVSNSDVRDLFNLYHLQNHINSKICLGAYYNNQLIASMTFGSLRKSLGSSSKENTYELLRFASVGNIPGIASKLFSFFIKEYNPNSIVSYCDRRWSCGDLYKRLGFQLERETAPNYWYLEKGYKVRRHRFAFTKHKIVEMGGDSNLTEWHNMQNFGYDRIWDCGNYKFVWSKV